MFKVGDNIIYFSRNSALSGIKRPGKIINITTEKDKTLYQVFFSGGNGTHIISF